MYHNRLVETIIKQKSRNYNSYDFFICLRTYAIRPYRLFLNAQYQS